MGRTKKTRTKEVSRRGRSTTVTDTYNRSRNGNTRSVSYTSRMKRVPTFKDEPRGSGANHGMTSEARRTGDRVKVSGMVEKTTTNKKGESKSKFISREKAERQMKRKNKRFTPKSVRRLKYSSRPKK